MSLIGIDLKISLGKVVPEPAPKYIAEVLESVEVTRTDEGASTFQISFHAGRTKGFSRDFKLLDSPLLKTFNRVVLSVSFKGKSYTLIDGFITHQELAHDREFGESSLVVSGEDVSVAMDIIEYSLEYPRLGGDAGIVALVLAKYALIGIIPEIIPPPSALIPISFEQFPQQNCTDRCYLNQIAAPHGCIFYVKPGPGYLMNTAYWGLPLRMGTVQKALTVDMGPSTNVERIDFKYDARAPYLVHGMLQDDVAEMDLPVATFTGLRLPHLASNQAIISNQPFVRNKQFTDPRLGYIRGLALAQGETNISTDRVVTVEGELDTLRYGDVLDAPGLVAVRGAGYTYDGKYYVQQVTHKISRGIYKQNFTLTREGTGSTISEV